MLRKAHKKPALRILATASVLLVLAAVSPAPVYQQQNRFMNEASQQDLSAQQDLQQVQPVVGQMPVDARQEGPNGAVANEGADLARKTRSQLSTGSADDAIAALHVAQDRVEASKPAPGKTVLWIAIASLFGFGVFFWFKKWADKNVPTQAGF